MKRHALTAVLLLIGTIICSAAKDDIKPTKDKATKKYGYATKDKVWVIQPIFDKAKKFDEGVALVEINDKWGVINTSGDFIINTVYDDIDGFNKNGLSEVWNKIDRVKYRGVVSIAGEVIIPLECCNINMSNRSKFIMADRYVQLVDQKSYRQSAVHMWGVYDLRGNTIFEPQFSRSPYFDSNSQAIVTDRECGLKGVIRGDGKVIISMEYLDIISNLGGYSTLDPCLGRDEFDRNGNLTLQGSYLPGTVIPYFTGNDDLVAMAYGHHQIGMRMHHNHIFNVSRVSNGYTACSSLTTPSGQPVDWGKYCDRFLRLELVLNDVQHTGDIIYSDRRYTVQAILYEANGEIVGPVSEWGYIFACSNEGVFYRAEGGATYLLLYDINAPYNVRGIDISGCSSISQTWAAVLDLNYSERNKLEDWYDAKDRQREILDMENVGILSYSQLPELSARQRDVVGQLNRRIPIMRRKYRMEQVRNLRSVAPIGEDGIVRAQLEAGQLHMKFVDDFKPFDFKTEVDETIWWGAHNDRYIALDLIPERIDRGKYADPASCGSLWDDIVKSEFKFTIQVNLYEDDGSYVRTIAESCGVQSIGDEYFILNDCKLIFARNTFRNLPQLEFKSRQINNSLSTLTVFNW